MALAPLAVLELWRLRTRVFGLVGACGYYDRPVGRFKPGARYFESPGSVTTQHHLS